MHIQNPRFLCSLQLNYLPYEMTSPFPELNCALYLPFQNTELHLLGDLWSGNHPHTPRWKWYSPHKTGAGRTDSMRWRPASVAACACLDPQTLAARTHPSWLEWQHPQASAQWALASGSKGILKVRTRLNNVSLIEQCSFLGRKDTFKDCLSYPSWSSLLNAKSPQTLSDLNWFSISEMRH